METTIIGYILGLYWGYMGYNGKENGNYYNGLLYDKMSKLLVSPLITPYSSPLYNPHITPL